MRNSKIIRARDLLLPFLGNPGEFNSITDVPGVLVGYKTLINKSKNIYTGCTAILPRGYNKKISTIWAGIFVLNGNGEMTGSHWINDAGYFSSPIIITNSHGIGISHHATTKWMINQYSNDFQTEDIWAMPVIAETYDGFINNINHLSLKEEDVIEALNNAKSGKLEEGNVGGGTGMVTYGLKGGTGTSSRIITIPNHSKKYTLGVLLQANNGKRSELQIMGVPYPPPEVNNSLDNIDKRSIIIIIATDAPLLPVQLKRLAKRAALGISRNGTCANNGSGDIFLAFSTANKNYTNNIPIDDKNIEEEKQIQQIHFLHDDLLNYFYEGVVQAVEEAVINAMVSAKPLPLLKNKDEYIPSIDHEIVKNISKVIRNPHTDANTQ